MTLSLYDRVIETTTTSGIGPVTLLGTLTGYQSFAVVGDGNSCYFFIYESNDNGAPIGQWEVAFGTYNAATPSLSRTTVISSSNNGNPVNFTAGITKRVVLAMPASKSVYIDNNGQVKFAAGTASAPAINFGTTNTGIFDVYGDGRSVGITIGGVEMLRADVGDFFYSFATNNRFYNGLQLGSAGDVVLTRSAAGKLTLTDGSTSFSLLQFGGTTSSFPALKRNAAVLEARLADDSAGATFKANVLQFSQDTWQMVTNGSHGFRFTNSSGGNMLSVSDFGNTSSFTSYWLGLGLFSGGTTNWGLLYAKGKDQLFQQTSLLGSTTTADIVAGIDHRSTATPAAGFGCTYQFQLQSSTTVARNAVDLTALWATATDASRKARYTISVYDNTTSRECMRCETDGSNPMVGFYGVNAVARQLLATGAGHTVDDVITALQTLGLLRQS